MLIRNFLFKKNENFKTKKICLGSALWGWSVDKRDVFKILDLYYDEGCRYVDSAWNYPINGIPNDKSAKNILSEWLKANKVTDLNIIYKVGSTNHKRTEENDLSNENLKKQINQSLELFDENIACVMVHWDNRHNFIEINKTCEFLSETTNALNIAIGLSGIQDIESYFKSLIYNHKKIYIQVKSNFIFQDEEKYKIFNNQFETNYFAYGISMGGIKLNKADYTLKSNVILSKTSDYHDRIVSENLLKKYADLKEKYSFIENFYHAAMYNIEINNKIYGYIVAPSSVEQMLNILRFKKAYLNEIHNIL